ncbi:MAG: tRNA uridine-5-carboxymethylaminomethyl(34) synthesis GTPase MnmE [candidate division KSB1 bacterium]|nr:tRNA uridine-5-carboxymethylaminomethyl(34) synthesis GTPase MnmE [candidate division KSB1 bacterium]
MIDQLQDTISAIATPAGRSGIAIVRLSGAEAIEIADRIFRGRRALKRVKPWMATFGKVVDGEIEIDEAIAIVFRAPHSYTAEDMVEIHCHGGVYVSRRILELMVREGARLAQPGEFTLRAFLNGRIDLSQAEAIADLIQAQTEAGLRASFHQLQGALSTKIGTIQGQFVDLLSLLELELDFAEEDVEFVERGELIQKLKISQQDLEHLARSYEVGRLAREGVKLVIVGKPNVGKSSLLNALVKEDRAIVTDIPGTTRDPLEVQLDVRGIWFRIFDTAGMKSTADKIEQEGVRRARGHLASADVVVHMFDGSLPLDQDDLEIIAEIDKLKRARLIRVINKADLKQIIDHSLLESDAVPLLFISVVQGTGLDNLEETIYRQVTQADNFFSDEILVTNARHWEVLRNAAKYLEVAISEAEKGVSAEYVALYLRDAVNELGKITGKVTSEDILNNIFSKFCIGK